MNNSDMVDRMVVVEVKVKQFLPFIEVMSEENFRKMKANAPKDMKIKLVENVGTYDLIAS